MFKERANNAFLVLLALNLALSLGAVGITKGEFLEEAAFGVGRPLVGPKWPKTGPKWPKGVGWGPRASSKEGVRSGQKESKRLSLAIQKLMSPEISCGELWTPTFHEGPYEFLDQWYLVHVRIFQGCPMNKF